LHSIVSDAFSDLCHLSTGLAPVGKSPVVCILATPMCLQTHFKPSQRADSAFCLKIQVTIKSDFLIYASNLMHEFRSKTGCHLVRHKSLKSEIFSPVAPLFRVPVWRVPRALNIEFAVNFEINS
jgi:hypothetical protein